MSTFAYLDFPPSTNTQLSYSYLIIKKKKNRDENLKTVCTFVYWNIHNWKQNAIYFIYMVDRAYKITTTSLIRCYQSFYR